jgi:hypothetical protein
MSENLTGQKVSFTYGRLVQVVEGDYYDGFGNPLDLGFVGPTGPTGPSGDYYQTDGYTQSNISLTLSSNPHQYFGISYSGPSYISLPNSLYDGKIVVVKDESGLANLNPITITAQKIDSATQSILQISHGSLTFIWRGSSWWTL